jgi:hypothetical protein
MPYAFAPGVFACRADGRLVILNRRADRYLMLPKAMEASVLRLIEGEPDLPMDREVRERLCTGGLVLQPASTVRIQLCSEPPPSHSLIDRGWRRPGAREMRTVAVSAGVSLVRLRFGGLDRALRRVERVRPPVEDNAEAVIRLADAFAELRLVVRALDRCLPLSIALAAAAKRRHAHARLILGVACDPFRAHAWVQLGPTVLNDRLDTVRAVTPILAL